MLGKPVFAQPQPTPDPKEFEVKHPSDNPAYKQIDALNREHRLAPLPFPAPRDLPEPRLTLAAVLGENETTLQKRLTANGHVVFHAVGDTGSTRGPENQNLVSDKMVNDFTDTDQGQPSFFLHLGDVIYSFGEAKYYYDQFYEPYRTTRRRSSPLPATTTAWLRQARRHDAGGFPGKFCASDFEVTSEAGGLSRTAQIQPGVFFSFEAPFVRILALYSNTLEDPGVISNSTIGDSQLAYLEAALTRVKSEDFNGALILAHHHPAYSAGSGMAGAKRCFCRLTRSARKPGSGRMRCCRDMRTTTSASPAITARRRFRMSFAAMAAMPSPS